MAGVYWCLLPSPNQLKGNHPVTSETLGPREFSRIFIKSLLGLDFESFEFYFSLLVGKISPLIAREQMQLNLPPGMCGKEAVTVVCNFSLLSTSDHYNSINANQPSKTVPLFTSREE